LLEPALSSPQALKMALMASAMPLNARALWNRFCIITSKVQDPAATASFCARARVPTSKLL
jgi:hypothetical protein